MLIIILLMTTLLQPQISLNSFNLSCWAYVVPDYTANGNPLSLKVIVGYPHFAWPGASWSSELGQDRRTECENADMSFRS